MKKFDFGDSQAGVFSAIMSSSKPSKAFVILPIAETITTNCSLLFALIMEHIFFTESASFTEAPPNLKTFNVRVRLLLILLQVINENGLKNYFGNGES